MAMHDGTPVVLREYEQKNRYDPDSSRLMGVPHDALGRPLRWNGWEIDWTPGGVIGQMRHADGRQVRYFYNHRGERIARQEGSDWRFYDYDDSLLQTEQRLSRPGLRHWWYQDQLPTLLIDTPAPAGGPGHDSHHGNGNGNGNGNGDDDAAIWQVRWFHLDSRGYPYALTDEQSQITWALNSGPFGEILPDTPFQTGWPRLALPGTPDAWRAADPMMRFPGQWEDETTGLSTGAAGDYDPYLGRFLQPSPLARPSDNPYLFKAGYPMFPQFSPSPDQPRS